ncbi:TetR/AcrR family transcriptional regulator [Actinomycetospora termitidis]|uniref:TetR/AcrR family transcriptional regulator C-terminal domain-containing protein n=1 Tax=Actinomycetospora termitidis TaxID=3053470 RepID=A0ABT7M3I8_9PSEU|nr:TetR/AcrR family transcriptional regulator C-terminal domain-containing protein [Actinomycetospora sp. Odt1-22]MDL5155229.1 TetR/AcrR family transcriptional regulator C-terminal domain-containing protein [Actinomycetospora sp. Odt1-22]
MNAKERRAARHAGDGAVRTRARPALSPERLVDTALALVAEEGYEALTMRRLATALDTGPASLYAHVVNKADLDELLISRLCSEVVLPTPDPSSWSEQARDVCAQLREVYLRYPGISRAALAMAPTALEILRVNDGLLGVLLAGGAAPVDAAYACDALVLYVAAYCLEVSVARARSTSDDLDWVVDRDEMVRRFEALPAERFPYITRHAAQLTAGEGHDRFDFTVGLMLDGLAPRA